MPPTESAFPPLVHEAGWRGAFTRAQADGAIPNGTRVVKVNSEPGDGNPDGETGIVLGSFRTRVVPGYEEDVCYFVEWRLYPNTATATLGRRLRAL